jgi:hypothetical protein
LRHESDITGDAVILALLRLVSRSITDSLSGGRLDGAGLADLVLCIEDELVVLEDGSISRGWRGSRCRMSQVVPDCESCDELRL